jgi:threonine dehydrogenase-like Zn-dependent dehydrogenase
VVLLCTYSAVLRGATRVYIIEPCPGRTCQNKSIRAIPINFTHGDPVAQILKFKAYGIDRARHCVGFECVNAGGKDIEILIITQAIKVTKAGGRIGLIGLYVSQNLGKAFMQCRNLYHVLITLNRSFKPRSCKRNPLCPNRRLVDQRPIHQRQTLSTLTYTN